MSDNSDLGSGVQEPLFGPVEPPAGQGILGTNGLQPSIDSNTRAVTALGADISNLASKMSGGGGGSATSSGAAAGAQNRGTGATGTSSTGGGYAGMLRNFVTFGRSGGGGAVGSGGGTVGGTGGGGGMTTFGAGGGVNGQPGGGGAGSGGWRGAVQTGPDVLGIAGAYGQAHMNTFMTMNTAATQAMWRSGLASGGVNQSIGSATRMIFGTAGGFQNVTAAGVGDAAAANGILGYTSGVGMYGANGAPNRTYQAAQSSMFAMGYANPYMTQTQVAAGMQQIYSPNSIRAMTALGVSLPGGQVAPQTVSPMSIAQSVFSRTFGGQTSVNAATMTAATGQGGSLNANLAYLGSQAGWSSSTVNAMETYLQQRNNAIQKGLAPSQVDTLLSQASSGNKSAASTLSQYGIGSSTVQSVKTLQAAQTSNLADQSGGFNDALQQSTSLLTEFNQVLGQILSSTGLSGAMGGAAGYGSMFSGVAGAASYMAGSGGMGGGMGFVGGGGGMGGGPGGMLGGIGMNMGMNYAMGRGTRYGAGRITAGWSSLRNRFGRSAQADAEGAAEEGASATEGIQDPLFDLPGAPGAQGVQGELFGLPEESAAGVGEAAGGEAAATAAGGMSLGMGLGLGAGAAYVGTHLNNALWGNMGHKGAGDDWVTDVGKGAGTTLTYAASGALIGSVVPGVGTAAGAIIGGAIGLGQSVWDWWNNKSGYSASNSSSAASTTATLSPGGYSSGYGGYTTGSIGGGTDSGTTSTAGPSSVTPAPGAANAGASTISKVVAAATAQVGKEYVYGAAGPDAFDCSGLMQWSYKQAGISIPRTSEEQMAAGSGVSPADALPGDLMFPNPGHVMMCIGGGKVVEARHTGTTIWIRSYSPGEYIAARRIVSVGSTAGQNTAASGGNGATATTSAGQTSGSNLLGGTTAGTSELTAITQNAQAALTDTLTATLALTAANTPFGATSLTSSLNASNPFASTGVSGAASPGSTTLGGTVKDAYGHTYQVPSGNKPSGTVAQWISTALSDMNMPLSSDNIGDIKDIINGESAGNPWSINLYDSNAAAGHPSEGIMQTIATTFNTYAMAGHKDIWNPVDNIIAGVRYAQATYKSLDNVPGVKAVKAGKPYVGYASGAWDLESDQVAALHKGEMVLPKSAAQSVRNAVISDALGQNAASAGSANSGVTLHFRPGAIQITIGGQVSSGTAQQAATAIVDGIVNDPRVKRMAVGL